MCLCESPILPIKQRTASSVLRDQNAPVGVRVSMNSVGAELRGMLGEAEFLAGLEYARRQGWLDIEGSDIRITETGFQAAAK